ncbi:hypothetical protein B0H13DRAFT_2654230 [Mycena leptocephala]|nr:hypothetical protein B0H13DRAFT_2654230 [Mycena leptocephala]
MPHRDRERWIALSITNTTVNVYTAANYFRSWVFCTMKWHPNFFNCSTNSVTLPVYFILSRLMNLKVVLSRSIRRQAPPVLVPHASTLAPLGAAPWLPRRLLYSMHTVPVRVLRHIPLWLLTSIYVPFLHLNSR